MPTPIWDPLVSTVKEAANVFLLCNESDLALAYNCCANDLLLDSSPVFDLASIPTGWGAIVDIFPEVSLYVVLLTSTWFRVSEVEVTGIETALGS